MKTYLSVTFNAEGAKPSEVVERLANIGLKPAQGNYDFIYEWDKEATLKDAIWFADKIHAELQGTGALFQVETTINL